MRTMISAIAVAASLFAGATSAQEYYQGASRFALDVPGASSVRFDPTNYGSPTICNNQPSQDGYRHCRLANGTIPLQTLPHRQVYTSPGGIAIGVIIGGPRVRTCQVVGTPWGPRQRCW